MKFHIFLNLYQYACPTLVLGGNIDYSIDMEGRKKSPQVVRLEWGVVELEDGSVFKDVKVFPGGARAWDWGETGTHHMPGIQLADVEELLDHGADTIVLTRGVLGRLGVSQVLIDQLEARGIRVHVAKTKAAVEIYNQLCLDSQAGILIHPTC